jgi:hypothetical protein
MECPSGKIINDIAIWEAPVVDLGQGLDTIRPSLPAMLDAGTGYISYVWQDNSTASTYEVTNAGLYWVMVTNDNGCSIRDSVYVDAGVFTEQWVILPDQVRIYPNPAKEVLHLAFELDVEREVILEMFTIANSLVYREDIKRAMVTEAQINVQDLTPGTYFLRVTTDHVLHNFLVIVE